MAKKYKQKPKKGKCKQEVNKSKKDKKNKLEKKIKKENTKKEKEEEGEKKEDKNKKLLEKINKVKYLIVIVDVDGCEDGMETFTENGEKIDPHKTPLYNGDFGFKVDVDTGRILDWPDTKLYAKVNVRAIDTGFYGYYDKDDNIIYEGHGYVPKFLGITSPAYGDNIIFDTDVNGFILDWKEKKIKEKIIKQLRQDVLGAFDF